MNLTFNVCWIEDQASDAELDAIRNSIRQNGFEPEIERIQTEDQIKEFATKQRHYHDYELILLDLALGEGLRGNKLAADVRRHFPSAPLLFYSGENEAPLRKMMFDEGIEGVYCVHRADLPERVRQLVGDLSPALNRLNAMRGLAAQVVANCDQELRDVILYFCQEPKKADEVVAKLKEKIADNSGKFSAKLDAYNTIDELLYELPLSSGVLFSTVRSMAREENGSDEVRDLVRAVKDYPKSVLFRRNTLAHALEERTEKGWIIQRGNAKPLKVSDFERYRGDFLRYHRDIRKLRSLLVKQQAE